MMSNEPRTTEAPAERRVPKKVIGFSIAGAVGGFLFGFDTAIINGAVDAITGTFGLSTVGIGVVVAITLVGAALGAFGAGWLADRWGRPRVMLAAAIVFLIAAVGSGVSTGFWDLAFWRLLTGAGVGIATVMGPLYISEIAPADIRGRLSSLQQMAIVLGIFTALFSDAWIADALGGANANTLLGLPAWRWMLIAGVIPSLIYGLLAMAIPESPRYLVSRNRGDAAERVLVRIQNLTAVEAQSQVTRIAETLTAKRQPRFRDVLSPHTGLLPIVWVGIGIAALQNLMGIDVIFYYSTSLWTSVGFGESASFALSVFSSIVNVVVTIVAILLIDRVGRRSLLLVGAAGIFFSLVLVAIGFSQAVTVDGNVELPNPWGVLTLIGANLFVVFFAVSWGPVVWVLLGEMFPNSIRGVALSIAAGVNWGADVVLNLTFPALREFSLPLSYSIYAAFALGAWLLVFYKVKETAHKELEDMSENV